MFLGPRLVVYPAPNLSASTTWMTALLGQAPYFDQDFYVGYNVNGYELALDPKADPARGPIAYWGVANADEAHGRLLAAGAESDQTVTDVGEGIRVAIVRLPDGAGLLGVIENPHFTAAHVDSPGPGR